LSILFLSFFCGALGKHHSQNHETQNTNAQTASAQDVSSDVVVVLSAISWTLVCVIDISADAIANVAKLSLDVFHGLFLLSFNCLYYSTLGLVCQAPFLIFLVAVPLTANLALNLTAVFLLELDCFALLAEVSGEVLVILEVYSVFHVYYLLCCFVLCIFIIT
jgi:hypothetical protein